MQYCAASGVFMLNRESSLTGICRFGEMNISKIKQTMFVVLLSRIEENLISRVMK